jgi:hypothetical protein
MLVISFNLNPFNDMTADTNWIIHCWFQCLLWLSHITMMVAFLISQNFFFLFYN